MKARIRPHSVGPAGLNRDIHAEQPSTTKKHEAYVALRRSEMEEKKAAQEKKF